MNWVLANGYRTRDLVKAGEAAISTSEMGRAVAKAVRERVQAGDRLYYRHPTTKGMSNRRTLFEKIWDAHVVCVPDGRLPLLYIDLHLVHEVTSPQAFDGLRDARRRCASLSEPSQLSTITFLPSHAALPLLDPIAGLQIQTLQRNCKEFGIPLFDH